MSYDDEKKGRERKEEQKENKRERVKWELFDIRDDLKHELEDLHDDLKDWIDDIEEEAADIKEELKDDLEDILDERFSLLNEIGDIKGELEQYGANARERIEQSSDKLNRLKEKIKKHEAKFDEKIRKKVEKAHSKAAKRINISVDPEMSEEWRDWAEGLGSSVSELVRKSMEFVKENIGDLSNLESLGERIEKSLKKSGIEDLGDKIEREFKKKGKQIKTRIHLEPIPRKDIERIKKRVQGLIKLQNSIPIEKLAQALSIPNEEAENLIYELVAEGVEGKLEEGVFKFTGNSEDVISKLYELIDKI